MSRASELDAQRDRSAYDTSAIPPPYARGSRSRRHSRDRGFTTRAAVRDRCADVFHVKHEAAAALLWLSPTTTGHGNWFGI